MTCSPFTLPNGQRGFVCTRIRRKHEPRCQCGLNVASLLCDWKLPRTPGKPRRTCDAPLCDLCTTSPASGKDLCPSHAAEWQQRLEQAGTQA